VLLFGFRLSEVAMYSFRFGRILEVKEKLMERKQGQLEEALLIVTVISNDISMIESTICDKYSILTLTPMNGNDFSVLTCYIEYLDSRKNELLLQREKAAKAVDAIRAELYDLARDVRMLENLKEKAARIVKRAENRKEQKSLDQIALRIEERKL
jgi:flagellar export protein FliJ